jgi:poly(A) polymerase
VIARVQAAIDEIRQATFGTPYEGRLFLVGGYVRDKLLGREPNEDLDIVLEGDGVELALFLHSQGISAHRPVVYRRFGTAKLEVSGVSVEVVGARAESYESHSRKPSVWQATLEDDAKRRDFTVNTLLEGIHTGDIVDPLGRGREDLAAGLIVTPLDPVETFRDDPLRMLRAIRFACRLDFAIASECEAAVRSQAERLSIVSGERIRDELSKMLVGPRVGAALRDIQRLGLLAVFAPAIEAMVGVIQNRYHLYDVWEHTVRAVEALPEGASLVLRLAALLHDVGKPLTRSVGDDGEVHFFEHERVGLGAARELMRDLRFPSSVIAEVLKLIRMHMRPGSYGKRWSDGAVRRLLRDAGNSFEDLLTLCAADGSARRLDLEPPDLDGLRAHAARVEARFSSAGPVAPLTGNEIMAHLGIEAGERVGQLKDALSNAVLDGRLLPDDTEGAIRLLDEFVSGGA